jgi:predicted Zn-ribbon and HTH transcriptional regulator
MGETKIEITEFKCERCGHKWNPRSEDERPMICPKCKSARWDQKK